MSKALLALTLLLSSGLACAAPFTPSDLPTWPRLSAQAFGCLLEQRTGQKDPAFNCANRAQQHDWGTACRITNLSYSGPQLSPKAIQQLHPLIRDVRLDWEYGRLQAVNVVFKKTVTPAMLTSVIPGLKLDTPFQRPNLMDTSLQQCEKNASCLLLQGFDHMGGADVDCEN